MKSAALNLLVTRMGQERTRAAAELTSGITSLIHKLAAAMKDIQAGRSVDAHLIANATMLTETIARWNLTLDIAPIVDEVGKERSVVEAEAAEQVAVFVASHQGGNAAYLAHRIRSGAWRKP
jgi:hypothetical protein